jgi:hypothetical protein
MDDCKRPSPWENSRRVSQYAVFGESIPQFPVKGRRSEDVNPDGVREETRTERVWRDAIQEFLAGRRGARVAGEGGADETNSEFTVNSP